MLQLFKFNNNTSDQHPGLVFDKYPITPELEQTMRSSCFDCHSNMTKYPWYAKIQYELLVKPPRKRGQRQTKFFRIFSIFSQETST
ncbi:MAG: heme-binding domain-containing protein [Saprospiraceae bacterium]|nr:heme-binding domain-containing protein [Saprospiraceae bacterium]